MPTTYTEGKAIVSSTNATPIVLEITSHGLDTGDSIDVEGHLVNTNANGETTLTVVDVDHVSLDGSVGNGVGGATGIAYPFPAGGTVLPVGSDIPAIVGITAPIQSILDKLKFLYASRRLVQLSVFTANDSSHTVPEGSRVAVMVGFGGGGGGGGGSAGLSGATNSAYGGGGGGGAMASTKISAVTPGDVNPVVIGAAGAIGLGSNNTSSTNGGPGGATTYGSIASWEGAWGGYGSWNIVETGSAGYIFGGTPARQHAPTSLLNISGHPFGATLLATAPPPPLMATPGQGGHGLSAFGQSTAYTGFGGASSIDQNNNGGVGAVSGVTANSQHGGGPGGGGGGGPGGPGGAAGAGGDGGGLGGTTGASGGLGAAAASNSGGGGGGGGGGGNGSGTPGPGQPGGLGGSGFLAVLYLR